MLAMLKFSRKTCSWICVFLVLIVGPIQAYGLVLCSGCEDGPVIEFSEPDGTCSSCPDEDPSAPDSHSTLAYLNTCGCIDQPLTPSDFAIQQSKDHFQQIHIGFYPPNVFLKPVVQETSLLKPLFPFSAPPPGSLALARSVVLLV